MCGATSWPKIRIGDLGATVGLAPILALAFPAFDPVAVSIGPIAIRWYALAYVTGLLLGWQYVRLLARRRGGAPDPAAIDDLLVWATLAIVLGGRVGYVLFYRPGFYLDQPLEALAIWHGGMSFHGGLLGVVAAIVVFARRRGVASLAIADLIAPAIPIGLFLGRIANFINGELAGRASDLPWAMTFPGYGPEPRHPSQLYEAGLEGLALFAVMAWLAHRGPTGRQPGLLTGAFLASYAIVRMICELYRAPDPHIGFLAGGATMGQLLSLPMLACGLWLIGRARRPG